MTDKRRVARKKSFLTAYVSLDASQKPIPCLVRDLSRTGARIILAGADRMPDLFELQINGRDQILHVETRWRGTTEIGVRLIAKTPVDHATTDRACA